jgi:hypothetical protein
VKKSIDIYNIILNIPVLIRKGTSSGNQTKAVERQTKLASFVHSWHNVKQANSRNVDISL